MYPIYRGVSGGNLMDIQVIGSRAFSVYIQEAELVSRHLAAGTMTARDARTLVAPLIGSDGLGAVNLELYPGRPC